MAIGYKNNGGVYANMDFPSYEYREFPKHVKTGEHGQYEVVYTKEEETKLLSSLNLIQENELAAQAKAHVDPQKQVLIERARSMSIPINTKWSVQKLQAVISEAEKEVDDLPPEDINVGDQQVVFTNAHETFEPVELNTSEDISALVVKAKSLGIPSARAHWGVTKLKERIAQAQADVE